MTTRLLAIHCLLLVLALQANLSTAQNGRSADGAPSL